MRPLPILLLAMLGVGLVQPSWSLSLTDAELLWRDRSLSLRQAAQRVAQGRADVLLAGQRPNPELSLTSGALSPQEGIGRGHLGDKRVDTVLRVEQLLERGGKRDLRLRGAEARLQALGFEREESERLALRDLRNAYYELLLAQERHVLLRDSQAQAERALSVAGQRLRAGDVAPVEVSRLRIEKARSDADLAQARGGLANARTQLAQLLGAPDEAASLVASDSWPELRDGESALADPGQLPEVLGARERLQAATHDRDLAQARRVRDVTLSLQAEHNRQNAPVNSYGFGLSFPLFVAHAHEGEIARAEAELALARLEAEQSLRQSDSELRQLQASMQAARQRVARMDGEVLSQATEVARATELAYARGAVSLLELFDARRTLRQLQLEILDARAAHARLWAAWQSRQPSVFLMPSSRP